MEASPLVPVHQTPRSDDDGMMPCCGRPPIEVLNERMTLDPSLVTCGKQAWLRVDHPVVAEGVLAMAGIQCERADLADFNDRLVMVRLDAAQDPQEWAEAAKMMQEDLHKRGSMMLVCTDDFNVTALTDEDLAGLGLQRVPQ